MEEQCNANINLNINAECRADASCHVTRHSRKRNISDHTAQMSTILRLVSSSGALPFNPHIGAIPHSFLIALILQWHLLSLAQVCRSSFPRTFISSLENLYIREDGYQRLGWQGHTENAQWMQLSQPFSTAVKNLYLSKEFAPCIAPCFPSRPA